MAIAGRAAGMIMAGLPAHDPETALAACLEKGIRAFLLPGTLLKTPARLAELSALIRRHGAEAGFGRPLIALGGGACADSSPPEVSGFPEPMAIAAADERGLARKAGASLGAALAAFGIDLVFAPRLDLATDPKAFRGVLGLFGEDPERVGLIASAFARGLADAGIVACGGRFPGCGSLSMDNRHDLARLSQTAERLAEIEALPFARAIRAGLPAMLVARVLVPALEPERIPAARSGLVIEGRLRGDLAFSGLVVGEALDGDPQDTESAALLGALAGCDLQLALAPEIAIKAALGLEKARISGELPESLLESSLRRFEKLFGKSRPRAIDPDAGETLLSGDSSRRLALKIAFAAATAFRSGSGFPLSAPPRLVVVALPPRENGDTAPEKAFLAALAEELPDAKIMALSPEDSSASVEKIVGAVEGRRGPVLILTSDAHLKPDQESLVHLAEEGADEVGVVALKNPYDAAFFPRASGLGAVYGFSPECARAAARLALGSIEGKGRCPVSIPGLAT